MIRAKDASALSRRRGRRQTPVVLLVAVGLLVAASPRPAGAFGFEDVSSKAQALAKSSYQEPAQAPELAARPHLRPVARHPLPSRAGPVEGPEAALPGPVLPPRPLLRPPVAISVVNDGAVKPLAFSPNDFDYGTQRVRQPRAAEPRLRRLPHPRADQEAEVLRRGHRLPRRVVTSAPSARTGVRPLGARVAVDTASPPGRSFPDFREFWLVTPKPKDAADRLRAARQPERHRRLSVRHHPASRPGGVAARLFLRRAGREARHRAADQHVLARREQPRTYVDFRPEVHDSDGLLLHFNSGEWLWRPLDNPRTCR